MRLKRLELFGFKSFADRTVFDFDGQSFTGIVGPNGCGKSNVVDGIRWVLGEQRPTSMRGAEMADVIFKGCASRPGMSVAEATLILDNSAGAVEERGPEVTITRRVFKSGEGEYLIDGDRHRLKDVREMLFDTGLGSRGYSVLEQGRIDAVLSANPAERRRVFEEAAGISRYRQRRHEAENRLKRVNQDMARLEDLLGELRTRVRSLKIQAGKAERYVSARDAWRDRKLLLFRHQYLDQSERLEATSGHLQEQEDGLTKLRSQRETLDQEVQLRERERTGLMSEYERLAAEAARVAAEMRAVDERRTQLSQRVASWEQSGKEEGERAEALAAQLAERDAEIATLQKEAVELEQAEHRIREQAGEKSTDARRISQEYRELRARVENQNERVLELLHERSQAANTVRHLEESRAPAEEREQRARTRLEQAEQTVLELRDEEHTAAARTEASSEALAEAQAELAALEARLKELAESVRTEEARAAELERDELRRRAAIDALLDREQELEHLEEGDRAALEAAGEDGPGVELEGLLADHLRTGTEHARALDAVLGRRARGLVARDPETARRVVRWLKETERGQAAVLTRESAALGAVAPADELHGEGVVGRLIDQVECDDAMRPLAAELCGGYWIVRDIDAGLALVARAPGARCVTPEGDLIDAAGLVGGHREVSQGAIGRRSTAAEQQRELERVTRELAAARAAVEEAQAEHAGAQDRLGDAREATVTRQRELADAEGELKTLRARLADADSSKTQLAQERHSTVEELRRLAADLEVATKRQADAQESFEVENARLAELEEQRKKLEEHRDSVARDEGRLQVEVTRITEQLEGQRRRITDLSRAREETSEALERARRISRQHTESARAGQAESEELAHEGTQLLQQRARLDDNLGNVKEEVERGQAALDEIRRQLEATNHELDRAGQVLGEARLERQRLELACADIQRRAEEELELTVEQLTDGFEPDPELSEARALKALEEEVRRLKSELDKLGPVNMEAFTELEETGGRLEFMEGQYTDLVESQKALNETLRTIDQKCKTLFTETFESVRSNFQTIFRQLFGGGKADVVLEEGVDVLEAGVEIIARPPGREMLSIALLSGGQRTLTALALLFAVFQSRPSPFCVLDEVDAALDDANIERFLAMLDGFRKSTQFIVVTHNKGTMGATEALFGVTMQTKGISRFVAVELDEVDEFVPDVAGKGPQANGADASARPAASVDPASVDPDTGEPVVEIVPASVTESGQVDGGTARREGRAAPAADGEGAAADGEGAPSEEGASGPARALLDEAEGD